MHALGRDLGAVDRARRLPALTGQPFEVGPDREVIGAAGLGDAVSEQVSQVVDDPRAAAGLRSADQEVNPNAIELAKERIGGLNEDIDTAIEEYFELLAERVAQ